MKPHKWSKEIKAWADGAEIEFARNNYPDIWDIDNNPDFNATHGIFRIKPQPKEPQYYEVYNLNGNIKFIRAGMFIEYNKTEDYLEYLGKIKLEVDDGTNDNS